MLVNVLVPHVLATLMYRTYTPGVVTAVFVNLPVMSLLAFFAIREHWVSGRNAVLSAVALPVVIAATIPMLFRIRRLVERTLHSGQCIVKKRPGSEG
jgi:hypothetical protein